MSRVKVKKLKLTPTDPVGHKSKYTNKTQQLLHGNTNNRLTKKQIMFKSQHSVMTNALSI